MWPTPKTIGVKTVQEWTDKHPHRLGNFDAGTTERADGSDYVQ